MRYDPLKIGIHDHSLLYTTKHYYYIFLRHNCKTEQESTCLKTIVGFDEIKK
jgi:hypothetical protein